MLKQEQSRAAVVMTADTGGSKRPFEPSATSLADRPERKWRRVLRALVERSASNDPRRWLNRFLAERLVGDHTLPSTIAELERGKALRFERQEIEVAGYAGEPARIMAYRLAPASVQRARELLGIAGATR